MLINKRESKFWNVSIIQFNEIHRHYKNQPVKLNNTSLHNLEQTHLLTNSPSKEFYTKHVKK